MQILTQFRICSWYLTSISLHLYNKHLFSPLRGAFPFPLFVTMIHMIVQGSFSYLSILFIWPRYRPSKAPSIRDFCLKVVPCGVATALDLGLSNASMKVCAIFIDKIRLVRIV